MIHRRRHIVPPVLVALAVAMVAAFPHRALARDLPEPVQAAMVESEALSDLRVSYTMTFKWADSAPVVTRYNASTKEWTLLEGDPKAFPKEGQRKFRNYKRIESVPGGLTYFDYGDSFLKVAEVSEDEEGVAYAFLSPKTPKSFEEAKDIIETRIVIAKDAGHMSHYEMRALKPFKPNVASKLEVFDFVQRFDRIGSDGPPVMTHVHWRAQGRRGLGKVDEEYTVDFSDFDILGQ